VGFGGYWLTKSIFLGSDLEAFCGVLEEVEISL